MPTDLNPEGVEAAAEALYLIRGVRLGAYPLPTWDALEELDRAVFRTDAKSALAAYQSTIHESSETLVGEIEARLAKATPGGWVVMPDGRARATITVEMAEFIAHAPSDIRALLDIIRSGGEGS